MEEIWQVVHIATFKSKTYKGHFVNEKRSK